MYKAVVFFDIDRTLLNSKKHLLSSTKHAIKLLKHNHVLPIIASGRNISMIRNVVRATSINNAVCDNGSSLIYHDHTIAQGTIPKHTLLKLVQLSSSKHDPLAFQTANRVAFNTRKRIPKPSIRRYENPPVIPDFYLHHKVIYISLFTSNHKHDRFYQKVFKGQLSIVRNCSVCLDVTKKGINKGTGVALMIKKLHLSDVPSFCFGNGLNDIPMFKQVDYPIAMGNGEECKKYAKYVTTDCDHNGIFNGLKKVHLV